MKYSFIIFLFISKFLFAQETPVTFWQNLCEYKTDGTGKSIGLKIKLSIPCQWTQADGERPHVVKKFTYILDTATIIQTLVITKLSQAPSKAELDNQLTQVGLKTLCKDLGVFISSKRIKVDAVDGGEIVFKTIRENPVGTIYGYSILYDFFYKDKIISIIYGLGSANDEKAKTLFENYKTLFRSLSSKTIFLSQWE